MRKHITISMFSYHNEFKILNLTILKYHITTTWEIHAHKKNGAQIKKIMCILKCSKINVLIKLKTAVPVCKWIFFKLNFQIYNLIKISFWLFDTLRSFNVYSENFPHPFQVIRSWFGKFQHKVFSVFSLGIDPSEYFFSFS